MKNPLSAPPFGKFCFWLVYQEMERLRGAPNQSMTPRISGHGGDSAICDPLQRLKGEQRESSVQFDVSSLVSGNQSGNSSVITRDRQKSLYRGSEASASYAAPSSGADSFRITDTGILSSMLSNFHLSWKALKNVPSWIFSMIFTAMPPAT